MAAKLDQKAYLQKYLGGPSKDKKKKKKKLTPGKGFKIIDDDLDVSKLRPLDGDELDIFDEGEDAPQIAGIIDERPEDVKKLEQFKTTSKWKVVNQDDGFNSKLQIEEIKKDVKETEKENELIFGKMYSDSEDEKKNDSDLSPPRKITEADKEKKSNSKKHNSDSDFSPPRRKDKESPKRTRARSHSSDLSPPRKSKHKEKSKKHTTQKDNSDSDISPPRKRDNREALPERSKKSYDSDPSPPRKYDNHNQNKRVRKPSRWGDVEEPVNIRDRSPSPKRRHKTPSPSRKSKKDSVKRSFNSHISPMRKSQKVRHNSNSPSKKYNDKKRNISVDSDLSPPRIRRDSQQKRMRTEKHTNNVKNKTQRHSSDSDMSPRKKRQKSTSPRKRRHSSEKNNKRIYNSDSDLSPPRREADRDRKSYKRSSDSPPPTSKKMAKTLEGKMAGLQDAKQLREENEKFRKREDEVFKKMGDEVSGRNALAVSRKSKRETSEDRQKKNEKAERQKELDEKYKKWSKGVKQVEAQQARVEEFLHEASKPLARHKDDRDLEMRLKDIERDGDPMMKYIREKKREREDLGPEKPTYKGNFPPNRLNIRPGYRWDGVDRSNGYEKKYFDQQSKRKAQEEEAYKWSTEDL